MPSTFSPSSLAKDERNNYQSEPYEKEFLQLKEQTNVQNNNTDFARDLNYGTAELLDALPKLWTRGVLYVVICFTVVGLPWATFSKVDETGTAKGRIEPQGATQKIDTQAGGSVKLVTVKAGDTVKSGQVILELESTLLEPELQQAQSKLQGLQNRQSQLKLLQNQLLSSISLLEQQNKYQAGEKMAQVRQARQNLEAKLSNYDLQKLEKQALVSQVRQQIASSRNDHKSAKSRLDIDSNMVARFSKLVEDGAVSITQIDQLKKEEQESKRIYQKTGSDIKQAELRLLEELNRYQATVNILKSEIKQAELRLQEELSSYKSAVQAGKLAVMKNQEQLKDIQTQITAVTSEIEQTRSQIKSIQLQIQQRIVRSPIDGVIFELPITKPGEVVQPGQRIAQIAPQNAKLILKAQMPSKDSGFLKLAMPVKIKFDAYPFQEYGIVPGKVTWISPDSKVSQTPQGNIDTYDLEISLDQQYIQNGNFPLGKGGNICNFTKKMY
ncbi:HlyD family efflux transporter periplasmic adaptor subunit [Sphaerospermopsis torques-reginae]|uniref:HlyD family efflux transporter periplasmic adaptor subunit n=1 Tax=Sphaerospermopsis torques-reginae ITEP-024 TaxID=984208 RepID=A0ABX8WUT9_9CYAN|nr:HlyD family efflux transporter periplasmic adaptor subunit [Sphaerospermopsis torques-reginae]QYX30183.1 HlyD family efflux transporter periplasmic adaptor subunit [Sphaerospermopsis torques-reginae ITEP-024]